MKKIVIILSLSLFSLAAQAASFQSGSMAYLSGQEKCASALNSYLLYRHNASEVDDFKLGKLEYQIEAMCEGFQVKLVNQNGAVRGVIEAVE